MESTPQGPNKDSDLSVSLIGLLSNSLVLHHTAPYLTLSSLFALGATSKQFRNLVHNSPNVFRYVDLSKIPAAQFEIAAIDHGGETWRNVQLDENVTEDDFYGGPLRGIFYNLKRQNILQDVQILVLDGLSVTADLVTDIILQDRFNVRILSIREVQNLNERKLQKALEYVVRPDRPLNTPRLKGLYVFGPKDSGYIPRLDQNAHRHPAPVGGVIHSQGAQIGAHWNQKSGDLLADIVREGDKWYLGGGKVLFKPPSLEWASTLLVCGGVISFDAVLCDGPRHQPPCGGADSPWYRREEVYLPPKIATHAILGCSCCKSAPEGYSKFRESPMIRFPLLAPPHLHSSTTKSAKTPFLGSDNKLLVRCQDCLRARFCETCKKWWCEECYEIPTHANSQGAPQPWQFTNKHYQGNTVKHGVIRSCFECGLICAECHDLTQLMCKICGGGYCKIHNEGSTFTTCDWCTKSSRRNRKLW